MMVNSDPLAVDRVNGDIDVKNAAQDIGLQNVRRAALTWERMSGRAMCRVDARRD